MIFQMWNGAWNKLQFKVCQVAHGSVAYLVKHSNLRSSDAQCCEATFWNFLNLLM